MELLHFTLLIFSMVIFPTLMLLSQTRQHRLTSTKHVVDLEPARTKLGMIKFHVSLMRSWYKQAKLSTNFNFHVLLPVSSIRVDGWELWEGKEWMDMNSCLESGIHQRLFFYYTTFVMDWSLSYSSGPFRLFVPEVIGFPSKIAVNADVDVDESVSLSLSFVRCFELDRIKTRILAFLGKCVPTSSTSHIPG